MNRKTKYTKGPDKVAPVKVAPAKVAVQEKLPKPMKVRKNSRKIPPEFITEDGYLHLPSVIRLELLHLSSSGEASLGKMRLKQIEFEKVLKEIDPDGKLKAIQDEMTAHKNAVTAARMDHQVLIKSLGDKLGLDMTKISFNDRTGIITELPDSALEKK
jgi:hypothetical protein